MISKNLRKLDSSSGRLNIPKDLLEFVGIKDNEQIALCECEEGIKIKPLQNIIDCKIIAIVKLDIKGRFVFPDRLLEKGKVDIYFELYVRNGDLIVQEIEV